jgi:hypothetical protein
VRQSNCLSFMEKFQKFLRADRSHVLIYDFEQADVTVNGERKDKGKGCDYAVIIRNGSNCNLVVLIECKGGQLSISDFEDARRQLEYSVDFVKKAFDEKASDEKAFDDVPILAVLCYDRFTAQVGNYLRIALNKPLRHGVMLILKKADDAECSVCR